MSASASARLGDFVEILSGFAFDAANFSDEGDIALIRIRDVLRGQSNTFYRGEYDPKYLIKEGEILIGMDGEFNRARWQSAPALLNQRVCRISSNSPRLADEYLFHFLPAALKSIEDATSFVTVKHLSAKQIREIEIPLPPIGEQRRIAAILDQAETLRAQRRAALAQLDSLTQSLFDHMFGHSGAILEKWPTTALGPSLEFLTSGSRGWAEYYAEEGELFLRIQNVRRDELSLEDAAYVKAPNTAEARRTLVQPGDVLLSITADLGRTAVVPDDIGPAFINQHLSILRTQAFVPRFLSAYLTSPMGQRQVMGRNKHAVKAGLNFDDIRSFQVPHPPISLQQAFATRIQAIEALKTNHRAALAELDALFASLQQRAFSGELTRPAAAVQAAPAKARDFSELCRLEADKGLEALIYVSKRMPRHDMYKSLKALYFGDKHHLEQHGTLIYGETYSALQHGPVPQAAYDLTKALEGDASSDLFADDTLRATLRRVGNQLIPTRDADFGKLGAAERQSLDWAIRYCGSMSFEQTKTASHDAAYRATPLNAPMAMADIIRMLPEAAQRRFWG